MMLEPGTPPQLRLLLALPDTAGALRLLDTFKGLSKRHQVLVVTDDERPEREPRLAELATKFPNLAYGAPPERDDATAAFAGAVRGTLDLWHLDATIADPWLKAARTPPSMPPAALRLARHPLARPARARRRISRLLRDLEAALPPSPGVLRVLEAYQPDLVFVSPGRSLLAGDYVVAARHLGVRVVALTDTWDGAAVRGLLHARPDVMTVWNGHQRRALVEGQGYPGQRIAVIGADGIRPWLRLGPSHERYCNRLGWDAAQPIILFAASEEGSAQQDIEHFDRWRQAAASHSDNRLSDLQALVCPHPLHAHAWREVSFAGERVVVMKPEKFFQALHLCDAVVTMDMTGVLEGAALCRPVIVMRDVTGRSAAGEITRFATGYASNRSFLHQAVDAAGVCDELSRRFAELASHRRDSSGRILLTPHGPDVAASMLMRRVVVPEVLGASPPMPEAPPASTWARRMLPRLMAWAAAVPRRVPVLDPTASRGVLVAAPTFNVAAQYRSVLEAFVASGHRVSVTLGSAAPPDAEWLPGVEYAGALTARADSWARLSACLRGLAAADRLMDRSSPWSSAPGRDRLLQHTLLPGSRALSRVMRWVGRGRAARWWLSPAEQSLPSSASARELLERQYPDLLLVLPALDVSTGFGASATQVDLVTAARRQGVRTVVVAANIDMSVNDVLLHARPHAALVWTDRQRQDARSRLGPGVPVRVTGAVPFDAWLDGTPEKRQRFLAALGLADAPFAFFAGSNGFVNDAAREVERAREWVEALRKHGAARLRRLPVLIRPAPGHTRAWNRVDFTGLGPVVLCPRRYEDDGSLDTALLAESVRYAAVVVSADPLVLTMASAMGTPAVGALALGGHSVEQIIRRLFPGVPWSWVSDVPRLVSATAKALDSVPSDQDSQQLLRCIVRPEGATLAASPLMVRQIDTLCGSIRPWPEAPLVGGFAVRWTLRLSLEGLASAVCLRRLASPRGLGAAVGRLLRHVRSTGGRASGPKTARGTAVP